MISIFRKINAQPVGRDVAHELSEGAWEVHWPQTTKTLQVISEPNQTSVEPVKAHTNMGDDPGAQRRHYVL